MSDDLISRSEVMKLIESKFVDGCLEQGDKTLIDGYGLLNDVSDIPTAYDVDKVVGRLEELRSKREEQIRACADNDMADYLRCKMSAIAEAVEIVKSGNIFDNQDLLHTL